MPRIKGLLKRIGLGVLNLWKICKKQKARLAAGLQGEKSSRANARMATKPFFAASL
jgi:hypothetical protein